MPHNPLRHEDSLLYLLDIFTYSCMNCLRSLKYLEKLHKSYKKFGLQLVIIHPFEWEFEKNARNVSEALKELGIKAPVILDPKRKLIQKLGIHFWPSQLLVKGGKVVYRHVGEGRYRNLEIKIKKILGVDGRFVFRREPTYSKIPAVYCGKRKNKRLFCKDGCPKEFGSLFLSSGWKQDGEGIINIKPGASEKLLAMGKNCFIICSAVGKAKARLKIRAFGDLSFSNQLFCRFLEVKTPGIYSIYQKDRRVKSLSITAEKGTIRIYSAAFE
ncbi:redoxin family protein [Candidatus Woesearchaeota archaeon]|nr:redoxin family protein [Candidatus Woesearchaeota archaeon]